MEMNEGKRGKMNFMGWLRIGPYILNVFAEAA